VSETLTVTLRNSGQLQASLGRSIAIALVYADALDTMQERANNLAELGLEAGKHYRNFLSEVDALITEGLDRVGVLNNDGSGDSGSAS